MPFGHCRQATFDVGSCHHGRRQRHRRHGSGHGRTAWLSRQIVGQLADRPLTGAAIIESLAARGADDALAGPAAVYPMLRLLTEMGHLVESRNSAGHAVYALDPERAELREAAAAYGPCRHGGRRRGACRAAWDVPATLP